MLQLADFINVKNKPLQSNEPIAEAQNLFLDFEYSHFPVLEDSVFIGSIGKDEAEMLNENQLIAATKYSLHRFFVRENANWFDVFEEFAKNNSNVLPILNQENAYVGYYELDDVLHFLNETTFIKDDGGIIFIEKATDDYSFSQVCQIVESNNAKILGLFVAESNLESTKLILKISHINFNEIIQTFRRYNYLILSEHQEDSYLENLKERSDYLTKYLNI